MSRFDENFRLDEDKIKQWLATESDFGFELRVGKVLRDLGKHYHLDLDLQHGGGYLDPNTGKQREKDFWIHRDVDSQSFYRISVALECKNIKPFRPVVVLSTPRGITESALFGIQKKSRSDLFSWFL